MSIVSSTFVSEPRTQSDGTVWVHETHTDSTGRTYRMSYKKSAAMDPQTIMEARAVKLAVELADREAEELTNG